MYKEEILAIDMSGEMAYVIWGIYNQEHTILQSATKSLNDFAHLSIDNGVQNTTKKTGIHTRKKQITKLNEFLMQAIETARNEIDGDYKNIRNISVNIGPGSFTGLRIALAFARGLQAGISQCNIIGIDTMQLWSYIHKLCRPLLVVNDARSKKFYASLHTTHSHQRTRESDILDEPVGSIIEYINKHIHEKNVYISGFAKYTFLEESSSMEHTINFLHTETVDIDTMSNAFLFLSMESISSNSNILGQEDSPLYVRCHI